MIVPSVKCLPCKIEDSSLILQNLPKKWGGGVWVWWHKAGDRGLEDRQIPGNHWPVSLAFGEFQASKIL